MPMHMNKNVCKCLKINDYKKKKIIKDINNNNKKEGERESEKEKIHFLSVLVFFSVFVFPSLVSFEVALCFFSFIFSLSNGPQNVKE